MHSFLRMRPRGAHGKMKRQRKKAKYVSIHASARGVRGELASELIAPTASIHVPVLVATPLILIIVFLRFVSIR